MPTLADRARAAHRAGQYRSFTEAVRALSAQDTAEHTKAHRAFVDSLPPCEHVRPRPGCPTCP
jgi:hypothetical protein